MMFFGIGEPVRTDGSSGPFPRPLPGRNAFAIRAPSTQTYVPSDPQMLPPQGDPTIPEPIPTYPDPVAPPPPMPDPTPAPTTYPDPTYTTYPDTPYQPPPPPPAGPGVVIGPQTMTMMPAMKKSTKLAIGAFLLASAAFVGVLVHRHH